MSSSANQLFNKNHQNQGFLPSLDKAQRQNSLLRPQLPILGQKKFERNTKTGEIRHTETEPKTCVHYRIGYLYTYWGPLGFVIAVALIREAIDDIRRYRRDKEVNAERYTKLVKGAAGNGGGSKILVASSGDNFLHKAPKIEHFLPECGPCYDTWPRAPEIRGWARSWHFCGLHWGKGNNFGG